MSFVDSSVSEKDPALTADLLRNTLRHVARAYDDLNLSLFGGRLKRPVLKWTEASRLLGAWVSQERSLQISPELIDRGWGELVEVLKHEMAHQYVDEVEPPADSETPHGPTFRRICEERGIDSQAVGPVRGAGAGSSERGQALLAKVQALLSLAQSDNQNEAEAAMAKARSLMLRYNLEAVARSDGRYCYRHLGKPTGRRMAWQRVLANILSEFFFVEIIIVPVYRPREKKRGSVLEACGTPTNLELAEYVHDFLVSTAQYLWTAHRGERNLQANRNRQSFLHGVMNGFFDKLSKESSDHREQGLIYRGDPELASYFRRRHPHVRSVSGRGRVQPDAYFAGHAAGSRIVLHRGIKTGQSNQSLRLLGNGGGT